jgi:hypothetical protein
MINSIKRKSESRSCKRYIGFILGVALLTSGCAHFTARSGSEAALRDLVSKEWRAKIDKEWGTVYDLTSSKFRKSIKRDRFIRGCSMDVESFAIANLEISSDKKRAIVTVLFDIQQMGNLFKGMRLKETWLHEDGRWYLDMPLKTRSPFEK